MKKRIFYFVFGMLVSLALYSCGSVTYFYSTIDSVSNSIQHQDNGEFLYEDDTVSIVYNFSGYDIPIQVSIYNKLDEPLFLDWGESSLIIDDESLSLANNSVDYQGNVDVPNNFEGSINQSSQTLFIPSQSRVKTQLATLTDLAVTEMADSELEPAKIVNKNLEMTPVRIQNYSIDDSPLYFVTYLTFYTSDNSRQQNDYFSISQDFYVSEVLKTAKIKPDKMNSNYRGKGNVCCTYIAKEASTFSYILATAGIIGILAVLEALIDIPADGPVY